CSLQTFVDHVESDFQAFRREYPNLTPPAWETVRWLLFYASDEGMLRAFTNFSNRASLAFDARTCWQEAAALRDKVSDLFPAFFYEIMEFATSFLTPHLEQLPPSH
ncbi:MAG: DUF479 domain-containing protein, partial [Lentisphaerae bacterium]